MTTSYSDIKGFPDANPIRITSRCKNADVRGKRTRGGNRIVRTASSNTAYAIQKSLDRWQRETCIIRNIIQFENELGRPLTMLDLLCRFDRLEIDCVSDMLRWLVVDEVYV